MCMAQGLNAFSIHSSQLDMQVPRGRRTLDPLALGLVPARRARAHSLYKRESRDDVRPAAGTSAGAIQLLTNHCEH